MAEGPAPPRREGGHLAQADVLAPDDPDILTALGVARQALGQKEQALEILGRILAGDWMPVVGATAKALRDWAGAGAGAGSEGD